MRKFGSSLVLATMLMMGGHAFAADELDRIASLDRLPAAPAGGARALPRPARSDLPRGWAAFSSAQRTSKMASALIAAVGDAAGVAAATPHFTRNDGDILRGAAWTVDVDASLRRPALAGNAIFTFVDVSDKNGNDSNGYTAVFQTNVPRTDLLAAQVVLPLEEGFQPGHIYRMRVTQLVHGKLVVLAEGDLQLE